MARRSVKELLKTENERLPVKLMDSEIRERGQRLAAKQGELESHVAREKQVKAELKSQKTAIEAEIQRLSGVIRDGTELRDVECDHIADFRKGTVRVIRKDTEQLVTERALSDSERQRRIDGVEPEPGDEG